MEKENKNLLLDHDYDGIKELDHPLPNWWVGTYILCIIFAAGYFFYYIVMDGPKLTEVYAGNAAELRVIRKNYLKSLSEFKPEVYHINMKSEDMINYGSDLFQNNCKSCHNKNGAGDIGPNLTDEYWLYAEGTADTVFPFLITGNPLAGMPAWGEYLSEDQLYALTAYIMSIQGLKHEKFKEAEGDHYPQE